MANSYGKYLIFLRQMQKQFKVEHSRVDRRSFEARNELSHLKCHSVECPFLFFTTGFERKGIRTFDLAIYTSSIGHKTL